MRQLVQRLGILLLAFICLITSAAGDSLRIVTWNLEWFPGNKPEATVEESKQHMEKAQKAVASLKPDVLLLQEVRDWLAAAELCNVVPGLQVQVISAFPDRPQNLVIASKIPADSCWSSLWNQASVLPPRGYAFAAIPLPTGKFLLTYSLHLKSNRGDMQENIALRHESARQLMPHIQEMLRLYSKRGACVIAVGGDFNTSLDDEKFNSDFSLKALIASGLRWTHEGVPFAKRITIPAEAQFPDNTFDHILTAGLSAPAAQVISFPGVSDHNPVILDVDLSKADYATKIDPSRGVAAIQGTESPSVDGGTFSANQNAELKAAAGNNVIVTGKVGNVGATQTGSIHFINFEGNQREDFVVIVRKANVPAVIQKLGITDFQQLVGKSVEVHGRMTLYKDTPQIELKNSEQLHINPQSFSRP